MATTSFYLQQAKLLLLLAAGDSDPVIKKLLNRRAQEYLHMADELCTGSVLAGTGHSLGPSASPKRVPVMAR